MIISQGHGSFVHLRQCSLPVGRELCQSIPSLSIRPAPFVSLCPGQRNRNRPRLCVMCVHSRYKAPWYCLDVRRMATLEWTLQRMANHEWTPQKTANHEWTPQRMATLEWTPQRMASLEWTPQRMANHEWTPQRMANHEWTLQITATLESTEDSPQVLAENSWQVE